MDDDAHQAPVVDDDPTTQDLMELVRSALATSAIETVFNLGGRLELSSGPVVVRWDGRVTKSGHSLALPLPDGDSGSEASLTQLLKDCEPATFGRKQEEILDEEYRKAGKMDTGSFSVNFHPSEHGITEEIAQSLGPGHSAPRGITAKLYKLNVYSAPSGKFKAHVDTPRSETQMGSLVVCLPHPHKGGQLAVRHQGQEVVHDWGAGSTAGEIQWAAFFSDCEHEVLEVTEGHRITLTYNLHWAAAPTVNVKMPQSIAVTNALENLLQCPNFFPNGGTIGYACIHAYAHTSHSTTANGLRDGLKGSDMVAYRALERLVGSAKVTAMLEDSFDADSDSYVDKEEEPGEQHESISRVRWVSEPVEENKAEKSAEEEPSVETGTRREGSPKSELVLAVLSDDRDADSEVSAVETTSGTSSSEYVDDGPEVDRVYLAHSPRRTRILEGEWGAEPFEATYIGFRRQDIVWINHRPDSLEGGEVGRELAAVYFTYGNEPGVQACYSYAVITAEVGPFGNWRVESAVQQQGSEAEKGESDHEV